MRLLYRQFFAFITILSFTLTQSLPAWALRPGTGVDDPQGGVRAGLEEALQGPAELGVASYGEFRDASGPLGSLKGNVRTVLPEEERLVGGIIRSFAGLPADERNVRDLVLHGARQLRRGSTSLARWLPSDDELKTQVEFLWGAAPPANCHSCGAMASLAAAHPGAHPVSSLNEEQQGEAFNQWEARAAALILLRLMREQGSIAYLESPDGHRMPADSMADLLQLMKALEAPNPQREWTGARGTLRHLADLTREGNAVLVSLDGVHHVTVYAVRGDEVVVSEPILSDDGRPLNGEIAMPLAEFMRQWTGGGSEGLLLAGLPLGAGLPSGARTVSRDDLVGVLGCCGVVNVPRPYPASESVYLGMPIQPDVNMYRRAAEAIQILESRGFDNSSILYKLDIPMTGLRQPGQKFQVSQDLQEWARANKIHLSYDDEGNLLGARFFAEARVAGAFTANEEAMRKIIGETIRRRVSELLSRLGLPGASIEPEPDSPDWVIFVDDQGGVRRRWGAAITLGLFLHTRFATKGGYQASNAHLWVVEFEGGVWTLSHNGDWESYDWARDHFESTVFPKENESLPPARARGFQGTTDSETLLNLMARLGVTRMPERGHRLESEAVTLRRTFRALDVLEALRAASRQLAAVDEDIQKARKQLDKEPAKAAAWQGQIALKEKVARDVMKLFTDLGFDAKDLTPVKQKDGPAKPNRAAYQKFLQEILDNPAMLDQLASADNDWKGCFIFTEHAGKPIEVGPSGQPVPLGFGAYLKAAAPDPFGGENGVFGKGLIITIQVSALHSDSGGVTAKTYSESTDAYFLVHRGEGGEVKEVMTASEVRGFSPQVGTPTPGKEFQLRPGLFVVYGTADVFVSSNWAIYTTEGTTLVENPVFSDSARAVNLQEEAKPTQTSWVEARTEEARELRRTISPFELEAMVQSVTLAQTVDRYTTQERGLWRTNFDPAPDGSGVPKGVSEAWATPKTQRIKTGSGSSTFTMMIGEHHIPTDALVDNSDAIRLEPTPNNFTRDTRMVVASQSGTTGAAKTVWDKAQRGGAVLTAMTNTPGSPIFLRGLSSGGAMVTYSTPETAVAATGTTVHQLVLDMLWGLNVLLERGVITPQEMDRRIKIIRGLVSRVAPDGSLQSGTLAKVLDSFFTPRAQGEEGKSDGKSYYWRAMDLADYMRAVSERGNTDSSQHHYSDDMRLTNITVIGVGDPATPNEVGLKVIEQIGKPGLVVRHSSTMLEAGFSGSDGAIVNGQPQAPDWNPSTVAATVASNRQAFTGKGNLLFPGGVSPRRILIVGNGEDQNLLDMVRATYRTAMPVETDVMTYEQAYSRGGGEWVPLPGTVVLFVRPGEATIPNAIHPDHERQLNSVADQLMARWDVAEGIYAPVFLCGEERSELSLEMQNNHAWLSERVLLLQGNPADREFAVFSAVDRMFSEAVSLALDQAEIGNDVKGDKKRHVDSQQASRDQAQKTGIQRTVDQTISLTGYNRKAIDRIASFASARGNHRGWRGFNFWPAGYGPREFLARDLALELRGRLQYSNYAEQPSNGSHGYMGAMHPGGEVLMWLPPVGDHEQAAFSEDYAKKVKEAIPRAVNPSFPTDSEPGMFVELSTESQIPGKAINDEGFVRLRRLRHNASEKTADGKVEWTMPDAFLATPTGDPLEGLVLNRLLAQEFQKARAMDMRGKGGAGWFGPWSQTGSAAGWERRGEIVIVVDPGEPLPSREAFYRELRGRFPKWECVIVTLTPRTADASVFQNSDIVFDLPTGHPAEILAATHGLSAVLARNRYEGIARRTEQVLRLIQSELEKENRGIFGREDFPDAPIFRGVAEIIRTYAQYSDLNEQFFDAKRQKPSDLQLKEKVRAVMREFESAYQEQLFQAPKDDKGNAIGLPLLDKRGVKGLLEDALEIYRIQLPLVAGHALNADQLVRYLIFQIQGLAKVVTNLSPFTLSEDFLRPQPELVFSSLRELSDLDAAVWTEFSGALAQAARDPSGERLLNVILESRGELPVRGDPDGLARAVFDLLQPEISRSAQGFALPGAVSQPVALTLGARTVAGTTEEGGITLDLGAFLADGLAAMTLGDEMNHREMEGAVSSLPTLSVRVEGSAGEDGALVQQAMGEAVFVLGEVETFKALPGQSRTELLGFLESGRALVVTPEFSGLLRAAHEGRETFTQENFDSAMQVVAATKPYGPVAASAEAILAQDRDGAWNAVQPLVAAVVDRGAPVSTGLEEQFLTWPEEISAHDPVREINYWRRNSEVLRSIRGLRLTRGPNAWRKDSDLRPLSEAEVGQLRQQGNSAEDWSLVKVVKGVTVDELGRVNNNRFFGKVELGRISAGNVTLPLGQVIARGIRGVELRNVRLGNDVTVVGRAIQNYVIKDNAVVRESDLIGDPQMTFGLGKEIEPLNEAGKRPVRIYPEMGLKGALRLSEDRSKRLQERYAAAHDRYVRDAVSDWGVVEEGAVIDAVPLVYNAYVGRSVYLDRAQEVRESVLLGGFSAPEEEELRQLASGEKETPEILIGLSPARIRKLRDGGQQAVDELIAKERTRVDRGAAVSTAVLQPGTHVANGGTLVQQSILMEHTDVEEGANLLNIVLGPDSFAGKSELGAIASDMALVTHHKPTSALALRVRHGVNFGSGTKVANHRGYGPWLEVWLGPGMFIGTDSVLKASINMIKAMHSLISTATIVDQDQTIAMPFSLIQTMAPADAARFATAFRAFNEIQPGWVLRNSLYLVMRNEWKWNDRQNAVRTRTNFEIFQPETVDAMREAREALNNVEDAASGFFVGDRASREMPLIAGLGKNMVRSEKRRIGIDAYSRFIRYYALQEFFREADRLEREGRLAEAAPTLLTAPSEDRRWEHARQILLEEVPAEQRVSLPDLLASFEADRKAVQAQLEAELNTQLRTFTDTVGDAAKNVLPESADSDKFIKDFRKATQEISERWQALAGVLTGLEEGDAEFARLQQELAQARQQATIAQSRPDLSVTSPEAASQAVTAAENRVYDFLARQARGMGAFGFSPDLASTAVIVDLTVDEQGRPSPAGALAVPNLPAGTVAIVSSRRDLDAAMKLAGKSQLQAHVIFLDEEGGDFNAAVTRALAFGDVIISPNIRLLSGRSREQVVSALGVAGLSSVEVVSPVSLLQILTNLGVDEAMRVAFMALFQRASDNWDGLAKYL